MIMMKRMASVLLLGVSTMVNAEITQLNLISKDGTKLNALLSVPNNQEIKAAILVVHGLQSHAEWHRVGMESWSKKGIASIVFDRRGSGKSEGKRGHFNSAADLQEDAEAAFNQLKQAVSTNVPLYVFGNSFGFMVSVPFVKNHASEISGLILSSPATASTKESDYSLKEKVKILLGAPNAKHSVAFSNEFITSNEKGLEYIANDDLVVNMFTSRFLRNALLMRSAANKNFAKLPVKSLVILAKNDRIVDGVKAKINLAKTAVGSSTLVEIDGDHDLTLSGHGNEVNSVLYKFLGL